ncbi:MAG TPA: hypothetical protein VG347_22690 [Verrucomicrobiae bacterium]|nr:hypothetical protein [Verrucomicrobiae bacterium]
MEKTTVKPALLITILVLLAGLVFAIVTQHVWEDYWITFRASKNLATGNGLVFTTGERLHTFTSPLGVLLPAAFYLLTGNHSDQIALWLFRVTSLAFLAGGLILLFQAFRALQIRSFSIWLTLALIGLDAKILDFCINGMETGLLLFFLALTIHGLFVAGPRQILRLGAGWAGLMWSRPDSCVYIAVLGVGAFLFLNNYSSKAAAGKASSDWFKTLFKAAVVCTILYLPWFIWAWCYYGSPIPHTIVAKGANQPPMHLIGLVHNLVVFPHDLLVLYNTSLPYTFLPGYADHGGWHEMYVSFSYLLGAVAALAWLVPVLKLKRHTRLLSLGYFMGNFYLTDILNYFPPWYLPVVATLGYLTLGLLFDQAFGAALHFQQQAWVRGWLARLPEIFRAAAIVLVIGQMAVTVCVARQLQVQQVVIEDGLRQPIGLWLRDHAHTPHDSVMLEPLGYIGYYSGLKMFDFPGLASKEMVEARKRFGARQNQIYRELKPDWLVLRPREVQNETYVDAAGIQNDYEQVRIFDATDRLKAIAWVPGRPYVEFDQTFIVFHRKPDAGQNPVATPPASP